MLGTPWRRCSSPGAAADATFPNHPPPPPPPPAAGSDGDNLEALQQLVAGLTAPSSAVLRPGAGDLQPTMATANPALLGTNLLHEIDQAAQVSAGMPRAPAQLLQGVDQPSSLTTAHVVSSTRTGQHRAALLACGMRL